MKMKIKNVYACFTDNAGNTICRYGDKYFDRNFKPIMEIEKHNQRFLSAHSIVKTSINCRGSVKGNNLASPEIIFDNTCNDDERRTIFDVVMGDESSYNTNFRNDLLWVKNNLPQIKDVIKITGAGITTAGLITQNPILLTGGSKLIQI